MEDLESTEGLDWERVATKVAILHLSHINFSFIIIQVNSDSFTISQRSATECKIHWLGDRHPRFNHSPWPASEVVAAKALVEGREGSDIDWVSVAQQLGVCLSRLLLPTLTVFKDTADSDRCHAPYYFTKDTRMGHRIRQAAGRGSQEIWYRELVTGYPYLHFPDELPLTKPGSCSGSFRGCANKSLSEPLVPDARSVDPSWQLESGGRYSITTSRGPLWPRVDGSGFLHPWTNERAMPGPVDREIKS